jgi:HNH endonuclease
VTSVLPDPGIGTGVVPGMLKLSAEIVRYLRDLVAERDGWVCRYCGRDVVAPPRGRNHTAAEAVSLATLDHWLPRARGGTWDLSNLVMSCRPCNDDKHTLTGDEYLVVLAYRRHVTATETSSDTSGDTSRPRSIPAPAAARQGHSDSPRPAGTPLQVPLRATCRPRPHPADVIWRRPPAPWGCCWGHATATRALKRPWWPNTTEAPALARRGLQMTRTQLQGRNQS